MTVSPSSHALSDEEEGPDHNEHVGVLDSAVIFL